MSTNKSTYYSSKQPTSRLTRPCRIVSRLITLGVYCKYCSTWFGYRKHFRCRYPTVSAQQFLGLIFQRQELYVWSLSIKSEDRGVVVSAANEMSKVVDGRFQRAKRKWSVPVHVECLGFCYMDIIKDELHRFARLWNNHRITPSINCESLSGRPYFLYYLPEISVTQNFLVSIDDDEISLCEK